MDNFTLTKVTGDNKNVVCQSADRSKIMTAFIDDFNSQCKKHNLDFRYGDIMSLDRKTKNPTDPICITDISGIHKFVNEHASHAVMTLWTGERVVAYNIKAS